MIENKRRLRSAMSSLLYLYLFLLPIGYKFSIGVISGHGERVGESYVLRDSVLTASSHMALFLNLTDIISGAIFILLMFVLIKNFKEIKLFKSPFFILILGLIGVSWLSLFLHSHYYTGAQFKACLLHLIKFMEISLSYLFVLYYLNSGGKVKWLLIALFIGGGVAGIFGLINNYEPWFSGITIFDRVESYGILVFLIPFLLVFLAFNQFKNNDSLIKALSLFFILLSFAVILCGKRTVLLGYLVSIFFTYFTLFRYGSRPFFYWTGGLFFVVFIFTSPFILSQFNRSFNNVEVVKIPTDVLPVKIKLKTEHTKISDVSTRTKIDSMHMPVAIEQEKRIKIWQGIEPKFSEPLKQGWLNKLSISGTDYSINARLGRWVFATEKICLHPWIGIGFYGSPYHYDFLTDSSYFQLLIDEGFVGLLIFILIMLYGFWISFRCRDKKSFSTFYCIGWRGMTIGFLVMSLSANLAYIPGVMGVYWSLTAIMEFYAKKCSKKEETSVC